MPISYLSHELRHLNLRLREAFASARGLTQDQLQTCRRVAMGLPCGGAGFTAGAKELIESLRDAVDYAGTHGMEGVVGWCMAAAQGEDTGGHEYDSALIGPLVAEFLSTHAPAPASVLDVASGTGWLGLMLAARGYEVALCDPAESFLERAGRAADTRGVGDRVRSLVCGSFADLAELGTGSYDACVCLRSLLYARSREEAEETLCQLGRIAARAVVVDAASKHGLILQLGGTFEVSAKAVEQILATGITPPARPEHGRVVYTCFSSEELREALEQAGLSVRRLVGCGMRETLELGTAEPLSTHEALQIEARLQREERMLDSFPNLLALCTKMGPG